MPDAKPDTDIDDPPEYLEDQLEEGLEDSFPASDPPSVARRHRKPPPELRKPRDEG
ncbi:hypothetical protein [Caulobacter sp. UNC279MFTsu5.1]|uniref:hypothetical protein n=1 Tax=Caulobacter sp. UNC279MFTsu5.1 TaxID=1502775 RepID=UPI00036D8480|nr:hypothetical protein [Caulobacter sp. UNC279MFTsu5.1]SFK65762.1 hypothetical protein SAMN02799626_04848 [Caulobacter sp. UNC279MFTsu5.1]